jgi:hypothetical protein
MTLEQFIIEDFMAAPVSICDTNIIVIFTKIAARKSSSTKLEAENVLSLVVWEQGPPKTMCRCSCQRYP